jgi:hypothetical protein
MGYDIYHRSSDAEQSGAGLGSPCVVNCGSVAALGAATVFLVANGQNKASSAVAVHLASRACTIKNLAVVASTAPGGSDTVVITVQKSSDKGATWTDTALAATIPAAGTATYDLTNEVAIAKGDLLAVEAVSSGATAAAVYASFDVV